FPATRRRIAIARTSRSRSGRRPWTRSHGCAHTTASPTAGLWSSNRPRSRSSCASSISICAAMRGAIDVLKGRVGGFTKMEVARRTVPCYKYVLEKDGEQLVVCLLVGSGKLYRFPYETLKGIRGLEVKARFLRG